MTFMRQAAREECLDACLDASDRANLAARLITARPVHPDP